MDQPPAIPVAIAPGAAATVSAHVPAAALPAWRAMCHIDGGGNLTLKVNGCDAPLRLARDSGGGPFRSEVFVEFVNHYRPKSLRARPEDCRQFRIDVVSLRAGENQFVFTNPTSAERLLDRFNLVLW